MPDRLYPDQSLSPGQSATSHNDLFSLVLQTDGNLVLYWTAGQPFDASPGATPMWATNTVGTGSSQAVMQGDGNFVLYAPGGPTWASGTDGHPGTTLVVQDDGNVVEYDPNNVPLWATNTTAPPDGVVLRGSERPEVYVIQGGQRRHIPDPPTLERNYGGWSAVRVVSDNYVSSIPQGPPVPSVARSVRVSNFSPLQNGLPFINWWQTQPDLTIDLPIVGLVRIGDAHNGLCGGMAFAARDLYEAGRLPPAGRQPAYPDPYFNYLVRRLFDSFNGVNGISQYLDWMNTPDHDTGLAPFIRRGLAWRTIVEEWPKLRDGLENGHPMPLALVCVASANPGDLGDNHQVLAYGYDLNGDDLVIHLYDPNWGQNNSARLSLSLANPTHTTTIRHNLTVRGFFCVPYQPADPAPMFQQAWWSARSGQLGTSDPADIITFRLDENAVAGDIVEFVLEAGPGITWRKVLNVPDGEQPFPGSSWDVYTQDARNSDRVSLWAGQVNNGQSLQFRKAGFLGIMRAVLDLGDLDGLPAGSRLTFRWTKDS
jgi:hypothetical protein